MNPLSEVGADPRLQAIQLHPLDNDQIRVVGVDANGNELGAIGSVSAGFVGPLIADAGISLGTATVHEGDVTVYRVVRI